MFKTTLSNIDLFSIAPILMYKGSTKINSLAGGLFSLVAIICLFISCIYFSKDLYNRTNPQTFTKKIISTNISFFNISYNKNLIPLRKMKIGSLISKTHLKLKIIT